VLSIPAPCTAIILERVIDPVEILQSPLYCVYLLTCADGSLYCGIALDPERRIKQHNSGKGSRYTAGRLPVRMLFVTENRYTRSEAQSLEMEVKKRVKRDKEAFLREASS